MSKLRMIHAQTIGASQGIPLLASFRSSQGVSFADHKSIPHWISWQILQVGPSFESHELIKRPSSGKLRIMIGILISFL